MYLQVGGHQRPRCVSVQGMGGAQHPWPLCDAGSSTEPLWVLLSFLSCTMGGSTGPPLPTSPVRCVIPVEHLDLVLLCLVLSVFGTWQGLSPLLATTSLFCLVNVYSFFQTQIASFLPRQLCLDVLG